MHASHGDTTPTQYHTSRKVCFAIGRRKISTGYWNDNIISLDCLIFTRYFRHRKDDIYERNKVSGLKVVLSVHSFV